MTPRTVAIVQARMGSTRLPGKVLLPLLGEPILTRVVRRAARAETVDDVVVATSTAGADDLILDLARGEGWSIARGSEVDLLDRYVAAAREHEADVVVRITSDCPLIDPELVDETVRAFRAGAVDYASNALEPRTWPRGLDVEVMRRDALETAWREDRDPAWREHATPYLYRHPERFRLLRVPAPKDLSGHRWCVDTPEDYELVGRLYGELGTDLFGWRDALAVAEAHPEWAHLNRHVEQKAVPSA
ncbi:MAG TPA: glycosyltransferase family protein [Candidatus Limnocylindrales bacterium]|nr:glycosyltransferase family protein [Candidatus Limnocylindrales bacterium]